MKLPETLEKLMIGVDINFPLDLHVCDLREEQASTFDVLCSNQSVPRFLLVLPVDGSDVITSHSSHAKANGLTSSSSTPPGVTDTGASLPFSSFFSAPLPLSVFSRLSASPHVCLLSCLAPCPCRFLPSLPFLPIHLLLSPPSATLCHSFLLCL